MRLRVSLKTVRLLNSPLFRFRVFFFFKEKQKTKQQTRWQVNKVPQVFILAMQEQQSPHNMFSVYSVRNPLINKRSLLLSYVPHLCIGHRCVNYWNAVFFFLLLRDRLRELAVTRFLLYVRKKKVSNLRGPWKSSDWCWWGPMIEPRREWTNPISPKEKSIYSQHISCPVRVSSNYPCPVLSHRPEYYPKETVFREQWTGTLWRSFSFTAHLTHQ